MYGELTQANRAIWNWPPSRLRGFSLPAKMSGLRNFLISMPTGFSCWVITSIVLLRSGLPWVVINSKDRRLPPFW